MARTNLYHNGSNGKPYTETILRAYRCVDKADSWSSALVKNEIPVSLANMLLPETGETLDQVDGGLLINPNYWGNNVCNLIFEDYTSIDDIPAGTKLTSRVQVGVLYNPIPGSNYGNTYAFQLENAGEPDKSALEALAAAPTMAVNTFNGGFYWGGWNIGDADFIEIDGATETLSYCLDFWVRYYWGNDIPSSGYSTGAIDGGAFQEAYPNANRM